jgi:hypothetical protein
MQITADKPDRAPMTMNVSKEADNAFVQGLRKTDPERYRHLARSMEKEAGRLAAERKQSQDLPKAA